MTPEEQRTLDLFEAVESRPDINQRQLAEELGISLGLANAFLKTILNKGWIRARKVKARRWLYFLTPQGSLEKSRLTLNYLQRTLKSFREIRNQKTRHPCRFWAQDASICASGRERRTRRRTTTP